MCWKSVSTSEKVKIVEKTKVVSKLKSFKNSLNYVTILVIK